MTAPSSPPRSTRGLQLLGALLAVVIVVVLVAISCRPAASPDPGPGGDGTAVLRFAGSTTLGDDLVPDLAEAFLSGGVRTDSGQGTTVIGVPPGGSGPVLFDIRAEGTETGIQGLRDATVDVAMASRPLTDTELTALSTRGDLRARGADPVVALDAVAVVTHAGNAVTALSIQQLRDVFTCRITDWAQLGGAPGRIRLLVRDLNSGTFEFFREAVLGGESLCSTAQQVADSRELASAVASDPLAIGFVASPYIGATQALELYDEGTRRLGPTPTTIRTESYLLTRRLYLYVPTLPVDNPLARQFVDFVLSPAGQQVVQADEFVSVFGEEGTVAQPCTADLPAYCDLVADAERAQFDVHFTSGTADVDNLAALQLDRLAESLAGPDGAGRQVVLAGFADNTGTDEDNLALSRDRAASAQAYLGGLGVTATVTDGFGEALPVASNDTPEGQEENRRVEVWVR